MSQHSSVRPVAFVASSPRLSRAMARVAAALTAYAPSMGVDITLNEEDADITVLHVVGYPETVAAINSIKARGKKYAMIQYCLRSTQKPSTKDWVPLWNDDACVAVWSYYNLRAMIHEDSADYRSSEEVDASSAALINRFYFAPMGVSPEFKKREPSGRARPYRIMTSGYVAESEGVEEAVTATALLGARQFHLGPAFPFFGEHVTQSEGISDLSLVDAYNRSEYVAGLRRCEGFEMPVLEGLLCGARPICFDAPHYRNWFGDHAEYIPEGTMAEVSEALYKLLEVPARPVTEEERKRVLDKFNWKTIATGFWKAAVPTAATTMLDRRLRLLWVGDAVAASGFSRATHYILDTLKDHYDVAVLAINYTGDPHPYPYPVYPALNYLAADYDLFGVKRIAEVAYRHRADVIVIQQDPWNFPQYLDELKKAELMIPVVGFVAVDGKNCQGQALNGLSHAIFWTQFGESEARLGGYTGTSSVIPLGVDTSKYFPMPRAVARNLQELPANLRDAFIVGNVNRNQPRKRMDLTVQYFCEWIKEHKHDDAYLFLHVAPTGDVGWNVRQLMRYYLGKEGRLILSEPHPGQGISESMLCAMYNCFDVQMTTTAGEGWGLPTLEGMACGIPQIVPKWAALGEWPNGAVFEIECTTTSHTQNNINVVGGVPDKHEFIAALEALYSHKRMREHLAQNGYERSQDPMFNWRNIGNRFVAELRTHLPRMLGLVEEGSVAVG